MRFGPVTRPLQRDLGYAEITSNFDVAGAEADVPGLSLNVVAPSSPFYLDVCMCMTNLTTGQGYYVKVYRDLVNIFNSIGMMGQSNSVVDWFNAKIRQPGLTPGQTYAYKVAVARYNTGTARVVAAAVAPSFFRAFES